VTNEQFSLWDIVIWEVRIIKYAGLDDNSARERLAGTEQRGTAVWAEVRCDLLASICNLRDLLGFTCYVVRHCMEISLVNVFTRFKLKVGFRYDEVIAVRRSRNFSAVKAVA